MPVASENDSCALSSDERIMLPHSHFRHSDESCLAGGTTTVRTPWRIRAARDSTAPGRVLRRALGGDLGLEPRYLIRCARAILSVTTPGGPAMPIFVTVTFYRSKTPVPKAGSASRQSSDQTRALISRRPISRSDRARARDALAAPGAEEPKRESAVRAGSRKQRQR